ncbi:hypothetical protein [Loigolactobacillus backii]|uniref:Uncharacterized protein n=1 Tax=Loigolactobacillus backii TaxID=375175 RepID=A0A192H3C7_9LACO|nr:hypothetical protein [Loigolactobacillus backii]ANK59671.1 hypothetical protein AYR52_05025 [Loigolactobacillus backii]ANK62763.1 hypothetical protein AYR53_08380 [Loigolactobacillus backii]ANK64666.1 hypothetical protein AYR54_05040 [Loigolactobacillus backii]ANK66938.1 hypothetical protein AYR55_04000 [Loigolactobacillus backii]ANK70229.1 hypothetical protein AYR56_08625 [Loigolactobacillus backii]
MTIVGVMATQKRIIVGSDSRLTTINKRGRLITTDHAQKLFWLANPGCIIATAGKFSLQLNHHWARLNELIVLFEHQLAVKVTFDEVVQAFRELIHQYKLDQNDFILAGLGDARLRLIHLINGRLETLALGTDQLPKSYFFGQSELVMALTAATKQQLIDLESSGLTVKLQTLLSDTVKQAQSDAQVATVGGPIQLLEIKKS